MINLQRQRDQFPRPKSHLTGSMNFFFVKCILILQSEMLELPSKEVVCPSGHWVHELASVVLLYVALGQALQSVVEFQK